MIREFKCFLLLLFFLPICSTGQYLNIQHHADFGNGRHYFTNTLEGLAIDTYGVWFGFIDVDHKSRSSGSGNHDWQVGANLIYFEINRYFSIQKWMNIKAVHNWDITIQYNDSDAAYIPYAYLVGLSINQFFSPFFEGHIEFLLRKEDKQTFGWQLTGVWFKEWKMIGQKWQFLGYCDWWKNDLGQFFMAEPQLVVNIEPFIRSRRIWIGTELEMNLSGKLQHRSTYPTLFVRYDF